MYVVNYTRPNASFVVNLFAWYSFPLHVDVGIESSIYFIILEAQRIWIVLLNISFCWLECMTLRIYSLKQAIIATSYNHAKNLALPEARQTSVWLRFAIQHVRETCGLCKKILHWQSNVKIIIMHVLPCWKH